MSTLRRLIVTALRLLRTVTDRPYRWAPADRLAGLADRHVLRAQRAVRRAHLRVVA